jgi:hypothetical protein
MLNGCDVQWLAVQSGRECESGRWRCRSRAEADCDRAGEGVPLPPGMMVNLQREVVIEAVASTVSRWWIGTGSSMVKTFVHIAGRNS